MVRGSNFRRGDEVPLPLLYRVEPDGPITWFWVEYLGDDAAKALIPMGTFQALRAVGVRKLVAFGVDERTISRHMKNWVVAPGRNGGQMAYCVDLGCTSLRPGYRGAAAAAPWRERS